MSRMMSLFRSKSNGSSSNATSVNRMDEESILDEIKLDDLTTQEAPVSPGGRIASVRRVSGSNLTDDQNDNSSVSSIGSSILESDTHHTDGNNDLELFGAVHKKIMDLEKENEDILLSLFNVEISAEDVEDQDGSMDGKSIGLSVGKHSGTRTVSDDGALSVDNINDLKRLRFEMNTATIKSLHANLLL